MSDRLSRGVQLGNSLWQLRKQVARALWHYRCVHISVDQPFEWRSGRHAPVYVDLRAALAHVPVRQRIVEGLIALAEPIRERVGSGGEGRRLVVLGIATGGIPYGVLVADRLSLPFGYVRPEPKPYGLRRQVEGLTPRATDHILLVEELISTGSAVLQAIKGLRHAITSAHSPLLSISVVTVFSYAFRETQDRLRKEGISVSALLTFPELLMIGWQEKDITHITYEQLRRWHNDPEHWQPTRTLPY